MESGHVMRNSVVEKSAAVRHCRARRRLRLGAGIAVGIAVLLVAVAMIWPRATGVDVWVHWPPLHAKWLPRMPPITIVAVVVAAIVILGWRRAADSMRWPAYLGAAFAMSWIWTMSLAWVDGPAGLSRVYQRKGEYFYDARHVGSIHEALTSFISRIPLHSPDHWHIHAAGHPPGALLFYVALDRLGIDSPLGVGIAVVTIGVTAVAAVAITVKTLGNETWARRTTPWIVLAPAAVWVGVAGDAVYLATAAWALALFAVAAKAPRRRRRIGAGLASGVAFGLCVYFSYGLVLLGILALTVLVLGRRWAALLSSVAGALAVAAAFTLSGFSWWTAYPVLVDRYYAGVASRRPYAYWVWADFAAWTFSAGLAVWAAMPAAFGIARRALRTRHFGGRAVIAILGSAALLTLVVASLSGMSKAENARIWLPFTVWALTLPALLPRRWQPWLLASQALTALAVQLMIQTRW